MSFGNLLAEEFHKLTKGSFGTEIELFVNLKDAFIVLGDKYQGLVQIIHGRSSFVDFNYYHDYISTITDPEIKTCELGDMLFIIYSKKKKTTRLMYMQNKKGTDSWSFKADIFQLFLLKHKPELLSVDLPGCVFNNKDILKNSRFHSITSYGIFYTKGNFIEMSYFPASCVSLNKKTGKSKARKAKYLLNKSILVSSTSESLYEQNIKDFGDSLYDMKIGEIIENSEDLKNIENYLKKHSKIWNEQLEIPEKNISNFKSSGYPTVCIINADYHISDINIFTV